MANTLRNRLLQDIEELQSSPYPNVSLHVEDSDITKACLALTVDGYGPMHITVEFPPLYPLQPPRMHMDSDVKHPNILGSYICASILNTTEGYTPAYTLKGIAIQLLSFFGSDSIEQDYGGQVNLDHYRNMQSYMYSTHTCSACGFGTQSILEGQSLRTRGVSREPAPTLTLMSTDSMDIEWPSLSTGSSSKGGKNKLRSRGGSKGSSSAAVSVQGDVAQEIQEQSAITSPSRAEPPKTINSLPNEVFLMIFDKLETEELWKFAEAWTRVGRVMTMFDVIRSRELQCFCLKKDYTEVKLGVGVSVARWGKFGSFDSEFDLLSAEGFYTHSIRRSVQGIEFDYWLPLPISNGHWRKVKPDVPASLDGLIGAAGLPANMKQADVLYYFMNDIVVKLNQQASEVQPTGYAARYRADQRGKSALTHASEKAIESYFHLFHLLLCLATETPALVKAADNTLRNFAKGENSKDVCPNLGHLLVAALISSVEMTEVMLKSIIKETITRNVVWMLDKKGADMPELAYMEPAGISNYRLQKTFDAGKTSYRLLMFLNLFRRVAVGHPRKPLDQLRDEAFARHGAPPRGSAKGLADSIKRIHKVSNFPEFLREMGVGVVSAEWFTNFLRECVAGSVQKGYSRTALRPGQALYLRQKKEPNVQVTRGLSPEVMFDFDIARLSFFPGQAHGGGAGRGGRGVRGGHGSRGGRGRGGH